MLILNKNLRTCTRKCPSIVTIVISKYKNNKYLMNNHLILKSILQVNLTLLLISFLFWVLMLRICMKTNKNSIIGTMERGRQYLVEKWRYRRKKKKKLEIKLYMKCRTLDMKLMTSDLKCCIILKCRKLVIVKDYSTYIIKHF